MLIHTFFKLTSLVTVFLLPLRAALAFDVMQPLPADPIFPSDNPYSEAKAELGKKLYFDTRLSRQGNLSCNHCHKLEAGGDDDGASPVLSAGKLKRSAPSVYNVAYMSVTYWDARETSLEAQAKDHLLDPRVMDMGSETNLLERIRSIEGYVRAFEQTFGKQGLNLENIAKAIATFERTLKTPDSAFDRYIRGDDKAISKQAKQGLKLFNDIGCMSCHFGVNFAGPAPGPALKMGDGFYELFPNHLGTEYDQKYGIAKDIGRYAVTLVDTDKHMFRVPPLRNIANTAPYFHNGSVATLEEAVRVMGLTQLKEELNTQQVADIVVFLNTLTGNYPVITLPRLPDTSGTSLTQSHSK